MPDALIEVWEADDDGRYDVQYGDDRVAARGTCAATPTAVTGSGRIAPTPYPIPHDGPVGRLLAATGRSPMRASHLHFLVEAPGLRTLVTHIFVRGDALLDSDSVFGVRDSLVKDFEPPAARHPNPGRPRPRPTGRGPASASTSCSPRAPRRSTRRPAGQPSEALAARSSSRAARMYRASSSSASRSPSDHSA